MVTYPSMCAACNEREGIVIICSTDSRTTPLLCDVCAEWAEAELKSRNELAGRFYPLLEEDDSWLSQCQRIGCNLVIEMDGLCMAHWVEEEELRNNVS